MEKQTRAYVLNVALAFVPDLVVCWAVMKLTDSDWTGFFITFAVLQAIYFFFWFKNALWAWLLFWIYRKEQMASHLENSFTESRFPMPGEFTTDLDDYFSSMMSDEELDAETRVRAAYEFGTLNGLKIAQRYTLMFQLNSAGAVAIKRYAGLAKRFAK